MRCFECEVVKSGNNCLAKITQNKCYSTEINRMKRLHENEFGYMLLHYKRDLL